MTGDVIDSPSAKNLEYLGEAFRQLQVPVLYMVGNHDYAPPYEKRITRDKAKVSSAFSPVSIRGPHN